MDAISRRQAEIGGHGIKIFRSQAGPALHQRGVRRPVFARGFVGILRQLGGAPRHRVAANRSMTEDVAQPITETIAEIGNDFVSREARRTVVAAVLDQGDGGLRSPKV